MDDDKMRQVIRHSLGIPFMAYGRFNRRWSYRNYYAGAHGGDKECEQLVERGYMCRVGTNELWRSTVCAVTDAGITFAGLDHKVRREDRVRR